MSEWTSPALYALISGHFYPEFRTGRLVVVVAVAVAVAMATVHSVLKLHDIDAFIS